MRSPYVLILSAALLAALAPSVDAFAATNKDAKPLTAVPPVFPGTKAPQDPNAMPQAFLDERQKIKNDFNAWLKENEGIQAQCNAARTPAAHADCDRKKQASQAKLDAIHARTRDMHRKIDTWRRKQAGLPPPEWWPQNNQKSGSSGGNGSSGGGSSGSASPPADHSVLVPTGPSSVPANTF